MPSRGDNAILVLGNPRGHKTLPYRNRRIYRPFLPPSSALEGLRRGSPGLQPRDVRKGISMKKIRVAQIGLTLIHAPRFRDSLIYLKDEIDIVGFYDPEAQSEAVRATSELRQRLFCC